MDYKPHSERVYTLHFALNRVSYKILWWDFPRKLLTFTCSEAASGPPQNAGTNLLIIKSTSGGGVEESHFVYETLQNTSKEYRVAREHATL